MKSKSAGNGGLAQRKDVSGKVDPSSLSRRSTGPSESRVSSQGLRTIDLVDSSEVSSREFASAAEAIARPIFCRE